MDTKMHIETPEENSNEFGVSKSQETFAKDN